MVTTARAAPAAPKLPLSVFAAVQAAVAEGFGLPEILALEGVEQRAWAAGDRGWKARIAADPAELARYTEELARAQDRLDRRVSPLGSDLRAWLAFLDACAAAADPHALLQRLSLGMNDLARLGRLWTRRTQDDPDLERRIAELRKQPPTPLPAVTVEPAVLRRSTDGAAAGAPAPAAVGGAPAAAPVEAVRTVDLGMEIYAAICAEVEKRPPDLAERLRGFGIASKEALAEMDARWRQHFDRDPTLERDFRRLVAHRRSSPLRVGTGASVPASPPVSAAPPAMPVVVVAPAALVSTSLSLDVPRGPALPFRDDAPPSLPPADSSAPRPSGSLGGTSLSLDVPQGPALPFPAGQPAPLAFTSLTLEVPRGPALPFQEGVAGVPAERPAAPALPPRPPSALGTTALAMDVPRAPAIPFPPVLPRSPLASCSLFLELPIVRPPPASEAAPAPPPAPAAPAPAPVVPEAPSPTEPEPPAPDPMPWLTIEQHAALTAELVATPGDVLGVLAKHRVTPEGRAAIDRHYQARVAAIPEVRAAWHGAYAAWFAARGRA